MIDINFEDYKSMKFIIANEEKFADFDFEIPQYTRAIEESQKFIVQINEKISIQKEYIEEYKKRINSLKEILTICNKILNSITSTEQNKPILDIDFILNLLASSNITITQKNEILSSLIALNNQVFEKEDAKMNATQIQPVFPIEEMQTTKTVPVAPTSSIEEQRELSETLKSRLSSQSSPVTEEKKVEISQSEEQEDNEIIDRETAKALYDTAVRIIESNKELSLKNGKYFNLIGFVQQIEISLANINASNELLQLNPDNIELIREQQEELRILDKNINEYQTHLRNLIKEKQTDMDNALLRPGEQYRLIYLMHPENSKQVQDLTEEDFFVTGLESFFEEDFVGANNVDNYRRISKLLNELRQGMLINKGRNEHRFNDSLKEYAVKKNYKVRIGYRLINKDTILIVGYFEQNGKDMNSDTSYTSDLKEREGLYGGKIEEIINRINTDPKFRQIAYCISRDVDDRIIDVLETKRTKGIKR